MITKLVRISYRKKIDFKMRAPPTSRMHGMGFVTLALAVVLPSCFCAVWFSQFAKSLSFESSGVSALCFRRDGLKETAFAKVEQRIAV